MYTGSHTSLAQGLASPRIGGQHLGLLYQKKSLWLRRVEPPWEPVRGAGFGDSVGERTRTERSYYLLSNGIESDRICSALMAYQAQAITEDV